MHVGPAGLADRRGAPRRRRLTRPRPQRRIHGRRSRVRRRPPPEHRRRRPRSTRRQGAAIRAASRVQRIPPPTSDASPRRRAASRRRRQRRSRASRRADAVRSPSAGVGGAYACRQRARAWANREASGRCSRLRSTRSGARARVALRSQRTARRSAGRSRAPLGGGRRRRRRVRRARTSARWVPPLRAAVARGRPGGSHAVVGVLLSPAAVWKLVALAGVREHLELARDRVPFSPEVPTSRPTRVTRPGLRRRARRLRPRLCAAVPPVELRRRSSPRGRR